MTVRNVERTGPSLPTARQRLRWVGREVLPGVDTPVTSLTLLALLVTTLVLKFGLNSDAPVLQWASTNLINMQSHPVEALFSSIFVTSGADATIGVVLALICPALERRAGHLRTMVVLLVGHIVATLATEGGLREAIWAHASASSRAFQLDIGASYVAFAACGALLRYIPRRWRSVYCAGLVACTVIPLAATHDLVCWGHLGAVLIGLLAWHWLPDSPGAKRTRTSRRLRLRLPAGLLAITSRTASAAVVVSLTVASVITLYSGSHLLPEHRTTATQIGRTIGTPGR
ncbi:MAG: rhomboid-like protein [Jatrophihabitantaceae bacterium]